MRAPKHGSHAHGRPPVPRQRHAAPLDHPHGVSPETAVDPLCGMSVDPVSALTHRLGDETFYFCSARCRDKFVADPARYLKPQAPRPQQQPTAAGTIWTCPMHPEIRRDGPGACPICGMALEPLAPSAEEGESAELKDMTRRLWMSVALTVPLLWSMLGEIVPASTRCACFARGRRVGQLLLATPVVLWAAGRSSCAAGSRSCNRSLNMFTLIALGTGRGLELLRGRDARARHRSPASFAAATAAPPLYFEAAAVIVTLVLLGQVLELRARAQTSGAIRALLGSRRRPRTGSTRRQRSRRPARGRASRRSTARAARREDSRRRRASSKARATSTNRCSPASPMPVRKSAGDR